MKKFFTLSFPKPKKTIKKPLLCQPRQSTLDAIMAFASQYHYLQKV